MIFSPTPSHVPATLAAVWVCVLATPAFSWVSSPWAEGYNNKVRLVAGNYADGAEPPRALAGVEIEMPDGWKTYWRNPGEAGGVAPHFDWSKSANLKTATVLYPAPKRFTDKAGDTVGYKNGVTFPVEIEAADPVKPVTLRLSVEYGVCKEICVPAEGALELEIAPGMVDSAPDTLIAALGRVPRVQASAGHAGNPVVKKFAMELGAPMPRILIEADFPGGAAHADAFLASPDGLFLPLPAKKSESGDHLVFEADLSKDVDLAELKGKTIILTLVGEKGQAEQSFTAE